MIYNPLAIWLIWLILAGGYGGWKHVPPKAPGLAPDYWSKNYGT